jgi:hypothetical protein
MKGQVLHQMGAFKNLEALIKHQIRDFFWGLALALSQCSLFLLGFILYD